jgi:hypothetical protein
VLSCLYRILATWRCYVFIFPSVFSVSSVVKCLFSAASSRLVAAIAPIRRAALRSRAVAVIATFRRRVSVFPLHKFALLRHPPAFPPATSAADSPFCSKQKRQVALPVFSQFVFCFSLSVLCVSVVNLAFIFYSALRTQYFLLDFHREGDVPAGRVRIGTARFRLDRNGISIVLFRWLRQADVMRRLRIIDVQQSGAVWASLVDIP